MEYIYSPKINYEDYASGRVLYGTRGIPNFPVRLQAEIFCRAKKYLHKKENLTVYDPCCGGGYSLTVLGFLFNNEISSIWGSDINPEMIACAHKNVSLLSKEGISKRSEELGTLYDLYHKQSHLDAFESCRSLGQILTKDIKTEIFSADCTKALPKLKPDIIITDVPYGNLIEWNDTELSSSNLSPLDIMLERLYEISNAETILAVCMDKKQKISCNKWTRLEKNRIGKRQFEILKWIP